MSTNLTSGDFLQNHAYNNVWCAPNQDRQAIIQPKRITPLNGAWVDVQVQWNRVSLPNKTSRFQVYQIGQIHPTLLGLFDEQSRWLSVAGVCAKQSILIDIYTARGLLYPKHMCWYRITSDRNLILAIEMATERLEVDLNVEPVFMRVYSNAYFQSNRYSGAPGAIVVHGTLANDPDKIVNMQQEVSLYRGKTGAVLCYVNGRYTDNVDLITARVGDYIEFVYDSSVVRIIDYTVSDLREFTSTLDSLRKYLLHHNGDVDTIDYHDDIDTYLYRVGTNSRPLGVLYHKNKETSLRMVTHRDYSVPVQRIVALSYVNDFLGEHGGLKLRMFIRNSGMKRPLVYERSRIAELYKLDVNQRLEAMTGLHAVVPCWQAHELENSQYTAIMRANSGGITRTMVQEAYGYNALSVLLGDTPTRAVMQSGQMVVKVPAGLQGNCTVYEYDADGLLLGWDYNGQDDTYSCKYPQAVVTEMIYGRGGRRLDMISNTKIGPYDPMYNYRFYRARKATPTAQAIWMDITGDGSYVASDGVFNLSANVNDKLAVLSNKLHLAYSFDYSTTDGLIQFNLTYFNGVEDVVLPFALGELDIFMNGYSLLEGLDYGVSFPTVTVVNKEYLNDAKTQAQHFSIRYTGFCGKDMHHATPPEIGFVKHGLLSNDSKFDLRDDRVMRIVCRGQMYLRDELRFAETNADIHITDALNGSPYAIRDIVVPMNNYLVRSGEPDDQTYEMRSASQIIDTQVSDYLGERLPMSESQEMSIIPKRYKLMSPFFSKIIHDLKDGFLWDNRLHQQYGVVLVKELCKFYEPLLAFDPITADRITDDRYVVIHPHDRDHYIELGIYQYRFLLMVLQTYSNKKLEIASFVSVQEF